MTRLKIYKLRFTSPLHIGDKKNDDYGTSLRTISSDTMYAALTASLAKMGIAIPNDGDLGFVVSSMFPFYQQSPETAPTYFLPQPMQTRMPHLSDLYDRKKVKKIKWVDTNYMERVLNGELLFDNNAADIKHTHGEYLSVENVPDDFVSSQVIQRVTLESRVGDDDAKPYYVDRVSFKDYAGLYFIAHGDTTLLEQAMALLQYEGIGTDRNVGNGLFTYEKSEINLSLPEDATHAVSLSLLIPESKEQFASLVSSEYVAYDIERRGGWITTYPYQTLRKNAIYGFTPGSVFRKPMEKKVEVIGRIVNLRPTIDFLGEDIHPIWRSGRAILLPIKL